MKFSITAHALKKALDKCNQIAPSSSDVAEARTGVLICAENNQVIFTACNDTLSIRVEVPAEISEAGEALVKCGPVSSVISATYRDKSFDGKDNFVTINTTPKGMLRAVGSDTISEGRTLNYSRNFPLLQAGFFSEVPVFESKKATKFPALEFMDGLSLVSHAASKDASKLHLNCICLTLTDEEIIFAATDGIQMAEYRKAAKVQGLRGSFILGLKLASIASKVIDPNLEFVNLYVENDQIFIQNGHFTLIGALLTTKFPDYAPFMDTSKYNKAKFSTQEFLSVLAGIQPSVDSETHRLVLDAKKSGTATLSTSSITSEAESSDLGVSTPLDFNLHFDSVFLQNATKNFPGEEFGLHFEPNGPGVLLFSDSDPGYKTFVCTLKKVE